MLVNHIDGFPLDRELDMNGPAAIISDWLGMPWFLRVFAVFTILFLFFLRGAPPNPLLHAVLAHIFEPCAVTAFFALCRAFGVLGAISL
jgi:hypothetical protein